MFNKLPRQAEIDAFNEDGFIIIEDIVSKNMLNQLSNYSQHLLKNPSKYRIFDWANDGRNKPLEEYNIIQVGASKNFPQLLHSSLFHWIRLASTILMQQPIDFWFDQFLIKPPCSGNATPWHQDEAYWGKALENKAMTCWIPLQDTNELNGCLRYLKGFHRKSILTHYHPQTMKSDLLACKIRHTVEPITCPIKRGSLILHHCRAPHMATANKTKLWRKAISIHLKNPAVAGEGELYPWRVYYDQQSSDCTNSNGKPDKNGYF